VLVGGCTGVGVAAGFVAAGFVAAGFVAAGFVADGFVADGFVADGFIAGGATAGGATGSGEAGAVAWAEVCGAFSGAGADGDRKTSHPMNTSTPTASAI
jgi:hypothetical protein